MKTIVQVSLFSIYVITTSAVASEFDPSLEPCINGEVSSTGSFPTQEEEDRYFIAQLSLRAMESEEKAR